MHVRGFLHVVYAMNADGTQGKEIGQFVIDPSSYNLGGFDNESIAEDRLNEFHNNRVSEPGNYRVVITNMWEDNHILTVDRPYPLPRAWTALSTWHAEATGRPSKSYAIRLLAKYNTDVATMGEHLEAFAAHDKAEITDDELIQRVPGYAIDIKNI